MTQVTLVWSWPNALWSFSLFLLASGIFWYKIHLLRMEIHNLVLALPKMGNEFVRREIEELKQQGDETRARLMNVECRLALNGENGTA